MNIYTTKTQTEIVIEYNKCFLLNRKLYSGIMMRKSIPVSFENTDPRSRMNNKNKRERTISEVLIKRADNPNKTNNGVLYDPMYETDSTFIG